MLFIDTSFIVGLAINKDQWHKNSLKLAPKVENSEKYISNIILIESLNILTKFMNGKELEYMYYLIKNNYNVYMVDEALQEKAIKITKQYDGTLGFADSTCLAIMKELGIHQIVSFDKHFDNKEGIIRIS